MSHEVSAKDSPTAHKSSEYDDKIIYTIPNYTRIHLECLHLADTVCPKPSAWLDTGCGTGTFAAAAMGRFPDTTFYLADPSESMLDICRAKLALHKAAGKCIITSCASMEVDLPENSLDVITAIQCHHYMDTDGREKTTAHLFRLLKPGGLYIHFENIRPTSKIGSEIGKERWRRFLMGHGRSFEEAYVQVERLDSEFFPITIEEHLSLLRETGFAGSEILWASYMQAGFYSVKGV
jgi:tRNA (cmo5U34)-methyltransferase